MRKLVFIPGKKTEAKTEIVSDIIQNPRPVSAHRHQSQQNQSNLNQPKTENSNDLNLDNIQVDHTHNFDNIQAENINNSNNIDSDNINHLNVSNNDNIQDNNNIENLLPSSTSNNTSRVISVVTNYCQDNPILNSILYPIEQKLSDSHEYHGSDADKILLNVHEEEASEHTNSRTSNINTTDSFHNCLNK